MQRAENDTGVNVVVLVGSGRGFCAGMDLVEFSSGRDFNHPDHPEWGVAGIAKHKISVPIIAAVHGVAAGGGFEIALACDLIVADDDAKIGLPEIKLGLFAAGAADSCVSRKRSRPRSPTSSRSPAVSRPLPISHDGA